MEGLGDLMHKVLIWLALLFRPGVHAGAHPVGLSDAALRSSEIEAFLMERTPSND